MRVNFTAHAIEHAAQIKVMQACGCDLDAAALLHGIRFIPSTQAITKIIEPLLPPLNYVANSRHGAVLRQLIQRLPRQYELVAHCASQALPQVADRLFQLVARLDHHLCCRRRSGGAQVGNEIGNGEIGFVSDGGD